MIKKITTLMLVMMLCFSVVGCSNDDDASSSKTNDIVVKDVDDFKESKGLVKYIIIDDYKIAIPETVGELANYLGQLGDVTVGDTGRKVDDVTLEANGISSMMAYLTVELDDGGVQHVIVRYENPTDDEITVEQAKVTYLEVKHDIYAEQEYDRAFSSVSVVTEEYTFNMDTKTKLTKFYDEIGHPYQATDGRLSYKDDLGYNYIFDCCSEMRTGLFRGVIIEYPTE